MLEHRVSNLLPVPTNIVPAEVRLAGILPEVERVATETGKHRGLRAHNVEVVREALLYSPTFVQKIQNNLLGIRPLLISRGFAPRVNDEAEMEKMVYETLDDHSSRPKVVNGPIMVADITGKIFRIIHPDVADANINELFSESEQVEIFLQALKISKHRDGEAAQELLLETMPRYYLHKIEQMRRRGMSFAEIVASNPELVPDLEQITWVAAHRLPKEKSFRLFQNPEEAKREAFRIERRHDQYARYIGYGAIYSTVEDIVAFAKLKGLVPESAENFDTLLKYMEETGEFVGQVEVLSHYRGNSAHLPEVRKIQQRIERYISGIPPKLQQLVRVVVFSNSAPEFDQSIEGLKYAVASVRGCSEDSVEELTNAIRQRGSEVNYDYLKDVFPPNIFQ